MNALGAIPLLLLGAVVLVECARAVLAVRRARRLSRAMHELRRPLQALSLMIERGSAEPDAGLACMLRAREALADLEEAACGSRAWARRRHGSLQEVLGQARALWKTFGVDVRADVRDGVVQDPDRLAAAVDNLVANALEHGGGPVSLRAQLIGASAEVVVEDAGAVAGHSRRGPKRHRGHGLSIVREYAARSGGQIELRSAGPGRGTSARISIPVIRPEPGTFGERG